MDKFSKRVTNWLGSTQSLFIHTIFFASIFIIGFSGLIDPDYVFAFTTNILSIEAIYLAIFIQMTVNKHSEDLEEVSEDIEEIQEDVDEIQKDVDEIQEDVEELNEDYDADEDTQLSRFEYVEHTLKALLKEIHDIKHHRNEEIDAGHHIPEQIDDENRES